MFSHADGKTALLLQTGVLAIILGAGGSVRAAEESSWAKAQTSAVRLISAGGPAADGAYHLGLEITLAGNGLTYWRTPGESGVPPVIAFDGSRNIASSKVEFPAPQRLEEGGSEIFGWRHRVVLPVVARPADPSQPAELTLDIRYASCDRICVPAEGRVSLELDPRDGPTQHAGDIAAAEALVPRPAGRGQGPALQPRPTGNGTWHIPLDGTNGSDLFAEGPEGWYFETKATHGGFDLDLVQKPDDATTAEVRLTLATPQGAWERAITLDATHARP